MEICFQEACWEVLSGATTVREHGRQNLAEGDVDCDTGIPESSDGFRGRSEKF